MRGSRWEKMRKKTGGNDSSTREAKGEGRAEEGRRWKCSPVQRRAAQRWQATGKHSYRWKGKCLRLTKNIGKSWALRESIHCKLADK